MKVDFEHRRAGNVPTSRGHSFGEMRWHFSFGCLQPKTSSIDAAPKAEAGLEPRRLRLPKKEETYMAIGQPETDRMAECKLDATIPPKPKFDLPPIIEELIGILPKKPIADRPDVDYCLRSLQSARVPTDLQPSEVGPLPKPQRKKMTAAEAKEAKEREQQGMGANTNSAFFSGHASIFRDRLISKKLKIARKVGYPPPVKV